jgi:DNA-binding response OmpR family regulator
MIKRPYESAGALIFDPVTSNRNATRASLYSLGFRKVDLAPSLEILTQQILETNPDLLLLEVTGAEGEVCQFAQSIRQGEVGNNPFIVIIVTTWRRDGTVVGKVINSGADDLVARPISTQMLGDRIASQIERRKGFAVTFDYIGPDRRRDPARRGGECLEVPNSLRLRTIAGIPTEVADRQVFEDIALGKQLLDGRKVRRDANQLCTQWRILEQRQHGTRDFFDTVTRVAQIASELKRRLPAEEQDVAGRLCTAIVDSSSALGSIREDSGTTGTDLALDYRPSLEEIGRAALNLGRMFASADMGGQKIAEAANLAGHTQVRAA